MKSILLGGLHYIKNESTGSEELYSIESDPGEEHDLAGADDSRQHVDGMRAALESMLSGGT
jgi:hypothetical protein